MAWIKCSDKRKPEIGDKVMVSQGAEIDFAFYDQPFKFTDGDGYPVKCTHWQPLPEPPTD